MNFANPQAFWFLAILPILWLLAFASRGEHASQSLLGATALRTLTVLSLVVALAQPQMMLHDQGISVVYAIDISRSVAPDFLRKTQEWIRATNQRYGPTEIHFVAFAEQARMLASIDDLPSIMVSTRQHTDDPAAIAQGATDIERGLRAALSAFGPFHERRIVLISDGRQTQGDLWRMLPRLQSEKVRVFAMPAPIATTSDAWVDAILAPDGVRTQEPVNLIVRVVSTAAMPAHVKLTNGKQRIGMTAVTLRPGPNDVAFETMLPKLGMNTLTASVQADADHFADNDTLIEGIWAGPRARVLYVEGVPESAHYLSDALRAHHIEVTVTGPDELIRNRPSMSGFDAIILSDVYQQSIEPLADSLEKFVRDSGGGLIFVAGESTFGKQGLAGSRIERLLPVRFEGKRKRLDLDLVLLIDRSHSMRGRKLEMAKTAALSTLDMLEERHRLAVVAFDVRAHSVVPLAPVGNKRRAEDSIASITASGQTNIFPALAEAQRMLAGSTATTKHIILLSDGITAELPTKVSGLPDAAQIHALIQKAREEDLRQEGIVIPRPEAPEPIPEIGAIEAEVAELNQSGITVSTIAIGEKPNLSLMRNIAAVGRGRSYVAHYDAEIPGLFVSETRRLLGESIVEENFRPVVAHAVASLNGLDFTSGPPLRGVVVARPKVFSDVLLQGPRQLPLLVTTRYGLGKTAAFLSDAKNRWSSDWIGWAGYARFWAQLVRDVISRSDSRNLNFRVTRVSGEASIELRALDAANGYRNGLIPSVRVTLPSGLPTTLLLRQTSPGRYAARMQMESGNSVPYRFELAQGGGLTRQDVQDAGVRSLSYPWSDELRSLPPDTATLQTLSTMTGGSLAPDTAEIFALKNDSPQIPRPMWPVLVATSLALFLLDILFRRAARGQGISLRWWPRRKKFMSTASPARISI